MVGKTTNGSTRVSKHFAIRVTEISSSVRYNHCSSLAAAHSATDSVLSVISNNGGKGLENHDFKLLFSRKPNDRMVATLVAMKMGVIEAKIESRLDGKDQADAFRSFKKHVELRLNELLETIPDAAAGPVAGPSVVPVVSPVTRAVVPDLPPAYEDGRSRTSSCKKG